MNRSLLLLLFTVLFNLTNFNAALADAPNPQILVNGIDSSLEITEGDTFNITISMETNGATDNADWWVVLSDSLGNFSYFSLEQGWIDVGNVIANLKPGYQGGLINFDNIPLNPSPNLSAGTYKLYFGVDIVMDGILQLDESLFYDEVELIVNGAVFLNAGKCNLRCSFDDVSSSCMIGNSSCESNYSYDNFGNQTKQETSCTFSNGYELSMVFTNTNTTAIDNEQGSCSYL